MLNKIRQIVMIADDYSHQLITHILRYDLAGKTGGVNNVFKSMVKKRDKKNMVKKPVYRCARYRQSMLHQNSY